MHRFLSALALVGTFDASALAQSPQPIAWEPFTIQAPAGTAIGAERGWLDVPEWHNRPSGRKIRLPIVRLRATVANAGPPIIWLAGGPGESGIARVSASYPLFAALRAYGDVIVFDQRGTGSSQPSLVVEGRLALPSDQSIDSDAARMQMVVVADTIRRTIEGRDIDLAAYNTRESARDVDTLRQALRADRVVLVAHSYGTHLALATVKYHGGGVERLVLGGVNGLDDRWREPLDGEAWLQRVSAAIRAESPATVDFVGQVRRVLAQLQRKPLLVPTAAGSVLVGKSEVQLLVILRSGDLEFIRNLPALFDDLERGTRSEDLARMIQQVVRQRSIGTAMTYAMHVASGVSESRRSEVRAQAQAAIFGNAINWGIGDDGFVRALAVPDLGQEYRAPFRSNVPALLIFGTLDGRTSEAEARAAGAQFARANYVKIGGASHDFFFRRPPGLTEIVGAFLAGEPAADVNLETPVGFVIRQ